MNRQRKVVITTTYNEMGMIIDTKAEELDLSAKPEQPQRLIPCGKCIHADGKHRWCKVLDRTINEDDFCCWAEPRKEGADE